MFTGIVLEVGSVEAAEGGADGLRLVVRARTTAARAQPGDSVATDGVCLTATGVEGEAIAFDVVPETVGRTTLGRLKEGDLVNVEPALRAGEPLGGHIVQGHVDGIGRVRTVAPEGDGVRLEIETPTELLRYCVEKGSIAVDGVSLTVAGLGEGFFAVALVPHTLAVTTLGGLAPEEEVNLEVDVLGKYVERLLAARAGSGA